jgi:alpha,alpha-trehalose phosphorylase
MRDHDGSLRFSPRLPDALTRLAFRLCFRGRRLLIDVRPKHATYSLRHGAPLEIFHHGEPATVTAGKPLTRPIPPVLARKSPKQPPGREPAQRASAKPRGGIERRAA